MSLSYRERAEKLLEKSDNYARTGCLLLDLVIGGGEGLGVPYGTGLNLVGISGSGKSLLGNEVIANEYHRRKGKLKHQYEDVECGNRFSTQEMYGLDIMGTNQLEGKPDTVEELDARHSIFLDKLGKGDWGIYLLDSLDGLRDGKRKERQEERKKSYLKGKDFDKGTYGLDAAKFLSQEFFRNQMGAVADKRSILIFVSQARQNMDPFSFKKWTQSGGNALIHWMTTTVWFSVKSHIKQNKKEIGLLITAKLEKSRHARPLRSCQFLFFSEYGIDDIGSNIDYLFDLRGEDGSVLKAAENVPWGNGQEFRVRNIANWKEWLVSKELYEPTKAEKKEHTGKSNLSVDWLEDEWLPKQTEEIQLEISAFFGKGISRDELIAMAEQDPKVKKEIELRVIAKWEEEEDKVKLNRRKKYEE